MNLACNIQQYVQKHPKLGKGLVKGALIGLASLTVITPVFGTSCKEENIPPIEEVLDKPTDLISYNIPTSVTADKNFSLSAEISDLDGIINAYFSFIKDGKTTKIDLDKKNGFYEAIGQLEEGTYQVKLLVDEGFNAKDQEVYSGSIVVEKEVEEPEPEPTIDIISEEEFRKDLEYLLSIDRFEANIETNKLVNRINDYIYFNLTGRNPATDVTTVVLSEDDMGWFMKKYVPHGYNEETGGFAGGTVVRVTSIKNKPDALEMFEKYGFLENTTAKYVTITRGYGPRYKRRSEKVLESTFHEVGHARDFLNIGDVLKYSGNEISLPQEEEKFYGFVFNESIARLYPAAASRFAQKELPDLSLKDNVVRGDLWLLKFTDPTQFDPATNINKWNNPFEVLIPWLAVLEEPDLAHLADELKENKMLSPESTLELQTYLISTPRNSRANYAYSLFTSPNYKTNIAEIREIATIRYNTLNPEAISSLHPGIHMP